MNQPQSLPKQIIKVWLIDELFDLIIACIIGCVAFYFGNKFWTVSTPYIIGLTVLGALYNISRMFLIPYFYRFWKYQITDDFVFIQAGFFFRKQHTIPINRIQNVDLEQGPLLQLTKLKKIKVVTAAESYSIDGITDNEAETLRTQIIMAARKARELNG